MNPDDLDRFLGRDAGRLAPRLRACAAGRLVLCWPGLLAPQAWFLYRKMHLAAALTTAGPLLLAQLPGWGWLAWSVSPLGALGLKFYASHAGRVIQAIRVETPDEDLAQARIARAGRPSWAGAAVGLVFAFALFVASLKAGGLRLK